MAQVTSGCIKRLYDNTNGKEESIVQIISIKPVAASTGSTRYRLIISDGDHYMQAMLASQHTALVESNELVRFSLIRIQESVCNEVQNRKILIILNLEIVSTNLTQKIGNPQTLENVASGQSSTGTAASAATSQQEASNSSLQQSQPQRPAQQMPQQPLFMQSNSFSSMQNETLHPIKMLNPYQNKWTIKARVTQKSPIKEWHNNRSSGKLFSVNLLDQSSEIKATAFKDQVDRLYNLLEEGKVYYISKARVTMARKEFSTLSNEYELTFENGTEIQLCNDEGAIPNMNYDFVKIADLEKYEKGAAIDIVAVVKDENGIQEIVSKASGKPIKKRELLVVDESQRQVRLTLWDQTAESFDATGNPIVVCKGVRVSDFDGRSLSLSSAGLLKVNVDIPEVHKLQKWYAANGGSDDFAGFRAGNMENDGMGRTTAKLALREVKDGNIGMSDRPDYFSSTVTTMYIKKENFAYPACHVCKKKVTQEMEDWRCEKCQKTLPSPDWRYVLTLSMGDATNQLFMNAFDEVGQRILGMNANELSVLKETDVEAFERVFQDALFKTYNVKVRAKSETYNDNTRTKYHLLELAPIDFVKEGNSMAEAIENLLVSDSRPPQTNMST